MIKCGEERERDSLCIRLSRKWWWGLDGLSGGTKSGPCGSTYSKSWEFWDMLKKIGIPLCVSNGATWFSTKARESSVGGEKGRTCAICQTTDGRAK